jgi:hypothetical protein
VIPIPAQQVAQKFAARLGTSLTTETVYLSLFDPSADIEEVHHKVSSARISVLVDPPPSESNPGTIESLRRHLVGHGLVPEFIGHIRTDDQTRSGWNVAILRGANPPRIAPAPSEFTVVAVMTAYNEADVIDAVIGHLAHNGVGVYLIDNWSTDSTLDRARAFEGAGLVGYERFPTDGPASAFELRRLLTRTEELAADLDADWIIHNDADEFRSAPWPGVSLRDALFHVQSEGFSAVDHGYLDFALTEDASEPQVSLEERLTWFEPQRTGDLSRLNCWRHLPGSQVELAWSGGHTVRFPERRVFPYNFLVHHFPIRSVEQGRRKIFVERLPRFSAAERRKGWHGHYDNMTAQALIRPTNGLVHLDSNFDEDFVLERLTGIGWEPRVGRSTVKVRIARVLRRLGLLDKALRLRRKPVDDANKGF